MFLFPSVPELSVSALAHSDVYASKYICPSTCLLLLFFLLFFGDSENRRSEITSLKLLESQTVTASLRPVNADNTEKLNGSTHRSHGQVVRKTVNGVMSFPHQSQRNTSQRRRT